MTKQHMTMPSASIPSSGMPTSAYASIAPKMPTSPEVPMPPPTALHLKPNTHVERGPTIALATMGGTMIWGRRMRLGIWSMLVPIPCAMSPPHLFSRKDCTAKPTMCAAQPTMDAPPASSMASYVAKLTSPAAYAATTGDATASHIAADDVGSVSSMPMTTAMTIPMTAGVAAVASATPSPMRLTSSMNGHAAHTAKRHTTNMTRGTTTMSTFVLPATSLPSSTASTDTTYAPMGLPGAAGAMPPSTSATDDVRNVPEKPSVIASANAPTSPATAAVNMTSLGALSACAIPMPMPAPMSILAIFATAVTALPITTPASVPADEIHVPI